MRTDGGPVGDEESPWNGSFGVRHDNRGRIRDSRVFCIYNDPTLPLRVFGYWRDGWLSFGLRQLNDFNF